MATPNRYYALAYLTTNGQVLNELPLAADPAWAQLINDPGTWTIQVPIGGTGIARDTLLEYTEQELKVSVAILWGTGSTADVVCQAGPITASTPFGQTEDPPIMQVGGQGIWAMLNRRNQIASTWPGVSLAAGGGADTSYGPTSTQGIAVAILQNAIARDPLPIDLPSSVGGTSTAAYFGYELVPAGQKLSELTQQTGGPDILLQPYLASSGSQIRHQALIGTPTLTSSVPVYFDYPGNISQILPTRDATKLARTVYVRGNGVEYATLWGRATDSTLTTLGWPLLEYVDGGHSSETTQTAIDGFAQGDLALYGRSVETWIARNRMELSPRFGAYPAGITANYNVIGSPYKRDGVYAHRIIGFQLMAGDPVGEVRHLLQATAGEI